MLPDVESSLLAHGLAALLYASHGLSGDCQEVVDGRVWLGDLSSAWDSALLRRLGITHVVAVTQFGRCAAFYEGQEAAPAYHIVRIQDVPEADLGQHLDAAVDFMAAALATGPDTRILVHCNRGRSRSVTTLAAYLVREHRMAPVAAIEHIKACRAVACPNPGFVDQLQLYADRLAREQRLAVVA